MKLRQACTEIVFVSQHDICARLVKMSKPTCTRRVIVVLLQHLFHSTKFGKVVNLLRLILHPSAMLVMVVIVVLSSSSLVRVSMSNLFMQISIKIVVVDLTLLSMVFSVKLVMVNLRVLARDSSTKLVMAELILLTRMS